MLRRVTVIENVRAVRAEEAMPEARVHNVAEELDISRGKRPRLIHPARCIFLIECKDLIFFFLFSLYPQKSSICFFVFALVMLHASNLISLSLMCWSPRLLALVIDALISAIGT
jgi:hypothetical protein